jgi:gamma-glutamyltranspeptidase
VNDVENGAVATDDPRCSEVGVSILRDYGGGAVDAAIAVVLCLQVVNPAGSTLGGGGFMLIHSDPIFDGPKVDFIDKRSPSRIAKARKATNKVTEVIDCREVAPASASPTMFEGLSPDATWYVSIGDSLS